MSPLVRIIPGVEIEVVKEIVPQILNPSGIVALIGTAERGPVLKPIHVGSYKEFTEIFGANSKYSLTKDAKLAFLNGVFEVVAIRVVGPGGKNASLILKDWTGKNTVKLISLSPGKRGNDIEVKVGKGSRENTVMMAIRLGREMEVYDNLEMLPESPNYLIKIINSRSKLVKAEDLKSPSKFPENNPADFSGKLSGGEDPKPPTRKDFEKALEKLEAEPDVDMVMACDVWDPEIHALIDAHCKNMSKDAMGRIGIGTVAPGEDIDEIVKRTEKLSSDRFILVAPYGVAGAVAGLISNLNYYESPTFKPLTGIASLEVKYTPSQLRKLLNAGILPVTFQKGRGIIVVKGITTSKEQINVVRITDHAVRVVNNIAKDFIGTLNNAPGRIALKERITEYLLRMEREGAIVPSVSGEEPAFKVDVYCSELDFAQGIVRVDLAIRPVRAIDYIYATILVQI